MTSTRACACEFVDEERFEVCSGGGMGRFADRQILTVVNLRLPIPVVERFGDGVILVPRFPEIRGVRLRADWIYGMAGRGDREY